MRQACFKRPIRVIALCLVAALGAESAAFAAPEAPALAALWPLKRPQLPFDLPLSAGVLEDMASGPFAGPSKDQPAVYLIQDAHTNPGAQKNIARIIDTVLQNDKRIAAVYSEAGNVGTDYALTRLKQGTTLEARQAAALPFLNKGLLQGSEYASLVGSRDFELAGLEDKTLYDQSLAVYSKVKRSRPAALRHLAKIERTLSALKPEIYGPALMELDTLKSACEAGEMSLSDYQARLFLIGQTRGVRPENYSHLEKTHSLLNLEKSIDFNQVRFELDAALEALGPEDRDLLEERSTAQRLSSKDPQETLGYFLLLEEKLKARGSTAGPQLKRYLSYLKRFQSIDPQAVLREQKELEDAVFTASARTPDQIILKELIDGLKRLKDLFELKLTPEEHRAILDNPRLHDVNVLTGFLNRKIMDAGRRYELTVFLEQEYPALFREALSFYQLAHQRDEAFIGNLLASLQKHPASQAAGPSAIMVTGGFHTPHLKELLKQNGFSYYSIIPQVTQSTDTDRYERILLSSSAPQLRQSPAAVDRAAASLAARLGLATSELSLLLGSNILLTPRASAARMASALSATDAVGAWEPLSEFNGHIAINPVTGQIRFNGNGNIIDLIPEEVWAVRHGQTDANTFPRMFQGQGRAKKNRLNANGTKQARDAAALLYKQLKGRLRSQEKIKKRFEGLRLFSSELPRAVATAGAFVELVKKETGVTVRIFEEPLLNEVSYGFWENRTDEQIQKMSAEQYRQVVRYRDLDARSKAIPVRGFKNAESMIDLMRRARIFINKINVLGPKQTVVIFGHGIQLNALRTVLGDRKLLHPDARQGVSSSKNLIRHGGVVLLNQLIRDPDPAVMAGVGQQPGSPKVGGARMSIKMRIDQFITALDRIGEGPSSTRTPVQAQRQVLEYFDRIVGAVEPRELEAAVDHLDQKYHFDADKPEWGDSPAESIDDQMRMDVQEMDRLLAGLKDRRRYVFLGTDAMFWERAFTKKYPARTDAANMFYISQISMLSQEEFEFVRAHRNQIGEAPSKKGLLRGGIVYTVMGQMIREAIETSSDEVSFYQRLSQMFDEEMSVGRLQKELRAQARPPFPGTDGETQERYIKIQNRLMSDRNVFREEALRIGNQFLSSILRGPSHDDPVTLVEVARWGTQPLFIKNAVRYISGADRIAVHLIVTRRGPQKPGLNAADAAKYPFLYERRRLVAGIESARPVSFDLMNSPGPGDPMLKAGSERDKARGVLSLLLIESIKPAGARMAMSFKSIRSLGGFVNKKAPNGGMVSMDGGSGYGKTTVVARLAQYLRGLGREVETLSLDALIRPEKWRTRSDEEIVARGKPYLTEWDYWDEDMVRDLLKKIFRFYKSGEDELILTIPNAWDQKNWKAGDHTIRLKKNTLLLIDGKYANRFAEYFDAKLRVDNDPGTVRDQFVRRKRPAHLQALRVRAYDLAYYPSYKAYEEDTAGSIDAVIDITPWRVRLSRMKDQLWNKTIRPFIYFKVFRYLGVHWIRSFFVLRNLQGDDLGRVRVYYLGMGRLIRGLLGPKIQAMNEKALMLEMIGRETSDRVIRERGAFYVIEAYADGRRQQLTVDNVAASGSLDDPAVAIAVHRRLRNTREKEILIPFGVTERGITGGSSAIKELTQWARSYYAGHHADPAYRDARLLVLNTDNVSGNGDKIRQFLSAEALKISPAFAEWVSRHMIFANSVVDRITVAGKNARGETDPTLSQPEGPLPKELVYTLPDTPSLKPASFLSDCLIGLGAKFPNIKRRSDPRLLAVDEALKIRVILPIHKAMSPLAAVAGMLYTQEAVGDPAIHALLTGLYDKDLSVIAREFAGQIAALEPGGASHDAQRYVRKIFEEWMVRISNPAIFHNTVWISRHMTMKIGEGFGPTVSALEAEGKVASEEMAFAIAAMLRFLTPFGGQAGSSAGEDPIFKGRTDPGADYGLRHRYDQGVYTEGGVYTFRDGDGSTQKTLIPLIPGGGQDTPLASVQAGLTAFYDGIQWQAGGRTHRLSDYSELTDRISKHYWRMLNGTPVMNVLREDVLGDPSFGGRVNVLLADPDPRGSAEQMIRQVIRPYGHRAHFIDARLGVSAEDFRDLIKREKPTVIILRSRTGFFRDPELIQFAVEHGCRVLIRTGSGVENIDLTSARALGVSVVRTNGTESAADLGVRFLFSALGALEDDPRSVAPADDLAVVQEFDGILEVPLEELRQARARAEHAGRGTIDAAAYERLLHPISKDHAIKLLAGLRGQTVGIIGFGRMGRTFAAKLQRLRELMDRYFGESFTVLATSPSLDSCDPNAVEAADALGVLHPGKNTVLERSSICSIHLPAAAKGYLTSSNLAQMQNTRVVINTARQAAVDEGFVIGLADRGGLYFADADIRGDLIDLAASHGKNVFVLPHLGGYTETAARRTDEATSATLASVINTLLKRSDLDKPHALDIVNGVAPHHSVGARMAEGQLEGLMKTPDSTSVKQLLEYVQDWLARNGYPHIGIVREYVDAVRAGVNVRFDDRYPVSFGKSNQYLDGHPEIGISPARVERRWKNGRISEYPQLFALEIVGTVVRESWGYHLLSHGKMVPIWQEADQTQKELGAKLLEILQRLGSVIPSETLGFYRSILNVASHGYAGEFYEVTKLRDYLEWASGHGLFSEGEVSRSIQLLEDPGLREDMTTKLNYLRSRNEKFLFERIFWRMLRFQMARMKDMPMVHFLSYYGLQRSIYEYRSKRHGMGNDLVQRIAVGLANISEIRHLSDELYPFVKEEYRVFQHNTSYGARMGKALRRSIYISLALVPVIALLMWLFERPLPISSYVKPVLDEKGILAEIVRIEQKITLENAQYYRSKASEPYVYQFWPFSRFAARRPSHLNDMNARDVLIDDLVHLRVLQMYPEAKDHVSTVAIMGYGATEKIIVTFTDPLQSVTTSAGKPAAGMIYFFDTKKHILYPSPKIVAQDELDNIFDEGFAPLPKGFGADDKPGGARMAKNELRIVSPEFVRQKMTLGEARPVAISFSSTGDIWVYFKEPYLRRILAPLLYPIPSYIMRLDGWKTLWERLKAHQKKTKEVPDGAPVVSRGYNTNSGARMARAHGNPILERPRASIREALRRSLSAMKARHQKLAKEPLYASLADEVKDEVDSLSSAIPDIGSNADRFFSFVSPYDKPLDRSQSIFRDAVAEQEGIPNDQILIIDPRETNVLTALSLHDRSMDAGLHFAFLDGRGKLARLILIRNDFALLSDYLGVLAHEVAHTKQGHLSVRRMADPFFHAFVEGAQVYQEIDILRRLYRNHRTLRPALYDEFFTGAEGGFEKNLQTALWERGSYPEEKRFVASLIATAGEDARAKAEVLCRTGDIRAFRAALGAEKFDAMKIYFRRAYALHHPNRRMGKYWFAPYQFRINMLSYLAARIPKRSWSREQTGRLMRTNDYMDRSIWRSVSVLGVEPIVVANRVVDSQNEFNDLAYRFVSGNISDRKFREGFRALIKEGSRVHGARMAEQGIKGRVLKLGVELHKYYVGLSEDRTLERDTRQGLEGVAYARRLLDEAVQILSAANLSAYDAAAAHVRLAEAMKSLRKFDADLADGTIDGEGAIQIYRTRLTEFREQLRDLLIDILWRIAPRQADLLKRLEHLRGLLPDDAFYPQSVMPRLLDAQWVLDRGAVWTPWDLPSESFLTAPDEPTLSDRLLLSRLPRLGTREGTDIWNGIALQFDYIWEDLEAYPTIPGAVIRPTDSYLSRPDVRLAVGEIRRELLPPVNADEVPGRTQNYNLLKLVAGSAKDLNRSIDAYLSDDGPARRALYMHYSSSVTREYGPRGRADARQTSSGSDRRMDTPPVLMEFKYLLTSVSDIFIKALGDYESRRPVDLDPLRPLRHLADRAVLAQTNTQAMLQRFLNYERMTDFELLNLSAAYPAYGSLVRDLRRFAFLALKADNQFFPPRTPFSGARMAEWLMPLVIIVVAFSDLLIEHWEQIQKFFTRLITRFVKGKDKPRIRAKKADPGVSAIPYKRVEIPLTNREAANGGGEYIGYGIYLAYGGPATFPPDRQAVRVSLNTSGRRVHFKNFLPEKSDTDAPSTNQAPPPAGTKIPMELVDAGSLNAEPESADFTAEVIGHFMVLDDTMIIGNHPSIERDHAENAGVRVRVVSADARRLIVNVFPPIMNQELHSMLSPLQQARAANLISVFTEWLSDHRIPVSELRTVLNDAEDSDLLRAIPSLMPLEFEKQRSLKFLKHLQARIQKIETTSGARMAVPPRDLDEKGFFSWIREQKRGKYISWSKMSDIYLRYAIDFLASKMGRSAWHLTGANFDITRSELNGRSLRSLYGVLAGQHHSSIRRLHQRLRALGYEFDKIKEPKKWTVTDIVTALKEGRNVPWSQMTRKQYKAFLIEYARILGKTVEQLTSNDFFHQTPSDLKITSLQGLLSQYDLPDKPRNVSMLVHMKKVLGFGHEGFQLKDVKFRKFIERSNDERPIDKFFGLSEDATRDLSQAYTGAIHKLQGKIRDQEMANQQFLFEQIRDGNRAAFEAAKSYFSPLADMAASMRRFGDTADDLYPQFLARSIEICAFAQPGERSVEKRFWAQVEALFAKQPVWMSASIERTLKADPNDSDEEAEDRLGQLKARTNHSFKGVAGEAGIGSDFNASDFLVDWLSGLGASEACVKHGWRMKEYRTVLRAVREKLVLMGAPIEELAEQARNARSQRYYNTKKSASQRSDRAGARMAGQRADEIERIKEALLTRIEGKTTQEGAGEIADWLKDEIKKQGWSKGSILRAVASLYADPRSKQTVWRPARLDDGGVVVPAEEVRDHLHRIARRLGFDEEVIESEFEKAAIDRFPVRYSRKVVINNPPRNGHPGGLHLRPSSIISAALTDLERHYGIEVFFEIKRNKHTMIVRAFSPFGIIQGAIQHGESIRVVLAGDQPLEGLEEIADVLCELLRDPSALESSSHGSYAGRIQTIIQRHSFAKIASKDKDDGSAAARMANPGFVDLLGDQRAQEAHSHFVAGTTRDGFALIMWGIKRGIDRWPIHDILLNGGTFDEAVNMNSYFPEATITIVNSDIAAMEEVIRWIQSAPSDLAARVRLFRADASHLDPAHFPDESFDLVYAFGLDESAFVGESDGILGRISEEETRLVRPGGFIYHYTHKGMDGPYGYFEQAIRSGVLETVIKGRSHFLRKLSLRSEPGARMADETIGIRTGRMELLLKRLASMEGPLPDHILRKYKTKELMKAVEILDGDHEQKKNRMSELINFIVMRKHARVLSGIQKWHDYARHVGPRPTKTIDHNLTMRFVKALPDRLRGLIDLERGRWLTSAYQQPIDDVRSADIRTRFKNLGPRELTRAVYYGAGGDILTPILALRDLAGSIKYVNNGSFDELFWTGSEFLKSYFEAHGITLVSIDEYKREMRITIEHRDMLLSFSESDNAAYAKQFAEKGDQIIFTHGLDGHTDKRELLIAHLRHNPDGVLFLCGPQEPIKGMSRMRLNSGVYLYQSSDALSNGARMAGVKDAGDHTTGDQAESLNRMLTAVAGVGNEKERVISIALGEDPLRPSLIRLRTEGGVVMYSVSGGAETTVSSARVHDGGKAFDVKVSDLTFVIQQANARTQDAWAQALSANPDADRGRPEVYLHLEEFLQNIAPDSGLYEPMIRYALNSLSAQIPSIGALHVLTADPEQERILRAILDEPGLRSTAQKILIDAPGQKKPVQPDSAQVHLVPAGAQNRPLAERRDGQFYIAMERAMPDPGAAAEFALPAFVPAVLLARILGMLPRGTTLTAGDPNLEAARVFFQTISGIQNVTAEEFIAWIQGKPTTRLLQLPAMVRVKLSEAIQAATQSARLSRSSA